MRIVLQRVREAWVSVDGKEVARIGPGFLLLVGIGKDDAEEEVIFWAKKIPDLRIFADEAGKLNRSLREVGGEVLCVSQFTLYGDVLTGRRPSFDRAASAEMARALYERFVHALCAEGISVKTGVFGAHMEVGLVNDGPVTLILERSGGKW
ncbi:MAG: D-aminoacyl-tRNA deacylase [Candidatus Bipolaricaulota bacterium]|nr:D-aminoacyl-tRNA deacylase [Candidatus Bipolaricaulota bacterium]MDW8126556.1 D-aminoacyl-tRNA deacylase [Candidatus Bipolaricaulota bacterium]